MRRWMLRLGLLLCGVNCSCAFHKTANEWNGLVGPDGRPVYLNSTTKVGFNLVIFVPFIGKTGLDGLVAEATQTIRTEGGDYLRVVQSNSDNYWYALPPITWVITPVVHSLVVEYRPRPSTDWLGPPGVTRPPDTRPPRSYDWRGTNP